MSLKTIYQVLNNISEHSGRLDKESIIKIAVKNELFIKVILYTLNPFKKFNTNRIDFQSNLPEEWKCKYCTNDNIFQMLDYLAQKSGATNEDIYKLSCFSSIDKETVEVVRCIINKDLRCGADIKTFKKFIPEIPTYDVMLCDRDLDKFLKYVNYDYNRIVWSIKEDGVRCTTSGTNGDRLYLSRNGKPFPNFSIFNENINDFYTILNEDFPEFKNCPIDGEMIAVTGDKVKDKDFQKLMTQVRRLNSINPDIFRFKIFDIVAPTKTFKERYMTLLKVFKKMADKNLNQDNKLVLLEHYMCNQYKTPDDLIQLAYSIIDQGEEGIVLKDIESFYEFKRSRAWCKIKRFETGDFKVLRWEYGESGKKHEFVVGKLICEIMTPEGPKEFGVGSGLSDQERIDFMKDTPTLIEVDYQNLTNDGVPRFGTFVRRRDDKSEPNY